MAEPPLGKPKLEAINDSYKRAFDLSVLGLAQVLLLPIWIVLWTVIPILIWIEDRNPIFYRQQRIGKNGQVFNVIKFRTMVVDAEEQGPAWTTENDPRVTKVGRVLRRTALDELPEIFNILQGHMSFVGPRALALEEERSLEALIPGFEDRLRVLPGLTGLAQIYDKDDSPYVKYRYDMQYLHKLSPFLDVQLILLSVWNTLIARWDHRSGKVELGKISARQADSLNDQLGKTDSTASDSEKSER